MPVARFQMPDGRVARFEVPEGTTPEQAQAMIAASLAQQPATPPAANVSHGTNDLALQVDSGRQEALNVLSGLPANARAGLAEAGNAVGRSVAQGLDFLGPGTANAFLRTVGVAAQLPTFEEGFNAIPGSEGGFVAPGAGRDALRGYWGTAPAALGGVPVAGRNIATPFGALAEFAGLGTAAPAAGVAPLSFPAGGAVAGASPAVMRATEFLPDSQRAQTLDRLVQEGSSNVQRAAYQLDPYTGRAAADDAAKRAETQGFSPGLIAMVQAFNGATRGRAAAMLDIIAKGKDDLRFAADNRPLNVIGDLILNRIKVVNEANRVAAVRLEDVAERLKGQQVDVNPAVESFLTKLTKMGMQYNPQTGNLILVQGSKTQDMPKVHKQAMAVLNRLNTTRKNGTLDAYDVHVMKGWIDNFVDMGKRKKGMIGSLEGAIKGLRHDLDAMLDAQFPRYNKINTQYSETRQKLDELQSLAGQNFDPNDASAALTMGSLARRFLSNAQSNGYLRDAVADLDRIARKYITPGTDLVPYKPIQARSGVTPAMLENDDLIGLAQYADQLDKMFGTHAGTSLRGDVDKGVEAGIEAAAGQLTIPGAIVKGGKWVYQKARRINEQNQIKAMRELLRVK